MSVLLGTLQSRPVGRPAGVAWVIETVSRRSRRRRFGYLQDVLPDGPVRILDVGGTRAYWDALPSLPEAKITLLNLSAERVPAPFVSLSGDARDLSQFPDQSFDIVYSNSVIGHVGTWADQQRMASELRRVGKIVVLQTPNYWFPVDWHTLLPIFHWLPASWRAWWHQRVPVPTYPTMARSTEDAWHRATRIRNLTARELRQLFPGSVLHRERMLGFTKSLVVVVTQRDR